MTFFFKSDRKKKVAPAEAVVPLNVRSCRQQRSSRTGAKEGPNLWENLTAGPKNHHQHNLSRPYLKFVSAATASANRPVPKRSMILRRVRRADSCARSKQMDNMDATHLQGFVGHFASRRFVPLGRSSSERAMSFPGCFSCVLFNERLTCSWYRNGALSVAFAWACDYANDSRTMSAYGHAGSRQLGLRTDMCSNPTMLITG